MKKFLIPAFMILLIILDVSVLIYFYNVVTAPFPYYICLGVCFIIFLLYLLYSLKLQRLIHGAKSRLIPVAAGILVLLLSGIFLYTGIRDLSAMKNPSVETLTKTRFYKKNTAFLKFFSFTTCRMEGMNLFDEAFSLNISSKNYDKYSYIQPDKNIEFDGSESYRYSEDSKLVAEYLPVSKKVVNLMEVTPSPRQYNTQLEELEAEIISVKDDRTMEAKVTDTKSYEGSDIKEGTEITIQGEMTILYPFNIEGFYEIKEGDKVYFSVSKLEKGDKIIVNTSVLNLVTE